MTHEEHDSTDRVENYISFKCQRGQNATSDITSRKDMILPSCASETDCMYVGERNTYFWECGVEGKHLKHESLKTEL